MKEGYQIPIRASLTQPILVGGAPRNLVIVNFAIGLALFFGLHILIAPVLSFMIHAVAVAISKKDPHFMSAILRHLRTKDYYHA